MNSAVQDILTSGVTLTDAALERLLPSATTDLTPSTAPCATPPSPAANAYAPSSAWKPPAWSPAATTIPEGAAELGAAIEMVHTYSLIHDDLPALDNDDLRRGQPTCHVVFGEAIAILAGDALQNLAFQTIANLPAPPATIVAILHDFALAIGTGVGAPYRDPSRHDRRPGHGHRRRRHHKPTAELVERIHRAKTGALITTSIVSGGLLA